MFRNVQTIITRAVQRSAGNVEQKRTTFILRRKNEPDVTKQTAWRKLKKKHYYYLLEEHTHAKKQPNIEMVLVKNVENVGNIGDIVKIPQLKAYEYFILTGAAVFATPENVKKFGVLKKEDSIPIHIQQILKKLSKTHVPVIMHKENPWTLERWHVRVALRNINVMCTDECIELPKEQISGPNMDINEKDFLIYLTMNDKYRTPMRCRLFQISPNEVNVNLAYNPKFYMEPINAIFPEEQKLLEEVPLPLVERKGGIVILND
ncbi:UNVERIFIED_CONTAM: hypothetical protein PYX00_007732 [Menopon gallinae]|uniref:Large ribosomal subunit protein bL9m n=1 Tax=Menopon gallinae TaxID=328185 RepID=A0AAW2HLG5_9NEOP